MADFYDIFLSFRGADTRNNFTAHLHKALDDAGFRTFQDNNDLERGDRIKEGLDKAIQQSRSSVIVFSKNYTTSEWCLDELVMILERTRNSDHVLFPIFYDHSPSQLREMAKCLAEVPGYQNQSLEKLTSWREALEEVTRIAGNELQNEANRHEPTFINIIVGIIKRTLPSRVPLSDFQKKLEVKLLSVNPVLDDAEGKQLKFQDSVKPWLHELKEAVYEAEDLLQEIKTEALRQEMEPESESSTSKVQALISSPPSNAFNSALLHPKVEKVLKTLDSFIESSKVVLRMGAPQAGVGYNLHQTSPSTSLVHKSVYGRDEDKERLVELLLSENGSGNEIGLIPIVGMGGIGKTTLAQIVYNDVRVKTHFKLQAWVCVSKEFDAHRIFQHIYESLNSEARQITSPDVLQSKLMETLDGKRFFFVLDDIWNKSYNKLESLMCPFQSGGHGSKIIITTRDESVARVMGSVNAHHLKPVSEEDGWSLFEKHAFRNPRVGARACLEAVGRQIVRKCNGLPLAIKSLGGLLCSKSNVEEWETILNSEFWELPEESDIMPSLWLSYMYLPLQLKRCFAYCSIFHKNYCFERSNLILLWKAVGLLQPGNKKSAEEIGRDYFNDLISRSFFQHSPTHRDVESYTMHDLINDLASFVSGEFCARWEGGSDSPKILSKTRHVNADFDTFEVSHQPVFLRTLFLSNLPSRKGLLINLLPDLQYLRVLKLSWDIGELPDSISNLKHLSHLDLSFTAIKKLPDTICTLYNLQALLLVECENLTELPANLGRLINLSHLDITGLFMPLIRMPRYMGNLKNLQTLPKFVLDRDTAGDNLPELEKLQSLRGRLYITGLEHSSGLKADILREKKFLNELTLEWRPSMTYRGRKSTEVLNEESEESVLEKLQPHLNLERLTIYGYGGKMFPGWPGFYASSALVHLTLQCCWNCVSLPPLGQLPLLKELQIFEFHGVVSIGSEFYYGEGRSATTCVDKPFRSLQSLIFAHMSGWKEWCTFVGGEDIVTFPKLTTLSIIRCNQLSSLPEKMHSHLPSLLSLSMRFCGALECIREGGFPSKLKSLDIYGCRKLKMNSDCLRRLTSLNELKLDLDSDDEKREDWIASEDEGLLPSSLTHLEICNLKCETIDKWFGHLNSLQSLVIWSSPSLRCLPESGLPPCLRELHIEDCPALQSLPESGLPPSLRELLIDGCPALQSLPESGLPPSLSDLRINACPLLEKRCQRETGEDWPKIAHIPDILINLRKI